MKAATKKSIKRKARKVWGKMVRIRRGVFADYVDIWDQKGKPAISYMSYPEFRQLTGFILQSGQEVKGKFGFKKVK